MIFLNRFSFLTLPFLLYGNSFFNLGFREFQKSGNPFCIFGFHFHPITEHSMTQFTKYSKILFYLCTFITSELPIVLSQWASCFNRPRNLLSPQALIRAVPALFIIFSYAICLSPSASIFFAALISLSCSAPHFGHIHVLTDKSFVSEF